MPFQTPPNIRQRLLPEVFLDAAKLNPDYPFAFTLESDIPDASVETITHKQFLSDVSSVAKKLQKYIPKRQLGTDVLNVGILGKNSYSYAVHWVACLFSHWTSTLISVKNSADAVKHLVSVSNSAHLIVDKEFESYARSLELTGVQIVTFQDVSHGPADIPELGEISDAQREEERELPAFYIHTSGSTGHPKIIKQTHKSYCAWVDSNLKTNPLLYHRPVFPQAPLYHNYGTFMVSFGIACGSAAFITHSNKPFTGESVLHDGKKFKAHLQSQPLEKFGMHKEFMLATVPSILVDVAAAGPETMNDFAKMAAFVIYGGGGLALDIGDTLAEHGVNIIAGFGMTETGIFSASPIPPKPRTNGEWRYMPLREGYKYHWIKTDEPGKAQLIVLPDTDSPAVLNSTDPVGFDTKDIWAEHPTLKGWYRHDSRLGDVIVLNNGEKTDSKQLQTILLGSNHKIGHIVVFGAGRSQNGILISPAGPIADATDYLNEIWPTVEHMNTIVPNHSRVVKELVLVEDPEIPFATTDKGTVKEKITLGLYTNVIDQAYEELELKQAVDIPLPDKFDKDSVIAFLEDTLRILLPNAAIANDADLFEHGMDSLLTVRLRSYILQLLRKAQPSSSPDVPRNIVYDHPSISALTQFILSSLSASGPQAEDDVKTRVRRTVERFTAGLTPRIPASESKDHKEGEEYVVVTGTTGSLGTFLVDQLLDRPTVKRIYCFNRKGNVETSERQLNGFKGRGLDADKLRKVIGIRVVMHDVDLSQPQLGLSESDYEEIRNHVTHIIHSAWQLNFNLRMEGFERVHIAGVRHLIDLALASPRTQSPRFVFLSSISTVTLSGKAIVPEGPVVDENWATFGYGLSKLVGERISEVASKKAGLNAAVVRIGQISGSSEAGAWAHSEYMPMLFRSCFGLGMVPSDLPPVRWIPTDIAASVTLKETFANSGVEGALDHYHLENPTTTPWIDIANAISQYNGANLPQVTLKQWTSKAREHGIEDAEKIPVIRLIEFYEAFEDSPALDVSNSSKVAPEVNFGLITADIMSKYLRYQSV